MDTIDWAAGLFEGEGYIRKSSNHTYVKAEICLDMCDLDIVERFRRVMGVGGNIFHTDHPNPNASLLHRYTITGKERVKKCLQRMLPFFGHRRAYTALNVLDAIDGC